MKMFIKFILFLLIISTSVYGQTTLTIVDTTEAAIVAGQAIVIPVNSTSASNLKSFTFTITYNPTYLKFTGIDASSLPNYSSNFSYVDHNGTISISYFNTSAFALNGKIFDLKFNYISSFSEIKFQKAKIKNWSGHTLNLVLNNGSFAPTATPAIRVVSPNGGENWQVLGPPQNITWTAVYIAQVKIEYTLDNGSSWIEISNSYNADIDSLTWTIPDTTSSMCKIRISDIISAASDESNGTFNIISTKSLTLISPNGGEELRPGGTEQIKWTQQNVGNIAIDFTTDFNSATPTWQTVVASTPGTSGIYEWAIPNSIALSTDCRIRISDVADSTVNSISSNNLSIVSGPVSVNLTDKTEANLRLLGVSINTVHPLSLKDNSYLWWEDSSRTWHNEFQDSQYPKNDTLIVIGTVPVTVGWLTSVTYLNIKINYDENVLVLDSVKSNDPEVKYFAASATNGVIQIIWSSPTPVDIHGHLFDLQFKYKDYNNSQKWLVPNFYLTSLPNPSPHGTGPEFVPLDSRNFSKLNILKFDVKDSRNLAIDASDWTNGSLSIDNGDFVKLLNPNGGEIFEAINSPATINWESRLNSGSNLIDIAYSTNSGSTWQNIVSSYDASLGSYSWSLPSITSNSCRIKIAQNGSPGIMDISVADFTIVSNVTLNLQSPVGGEVFQSGEKASIIWASTNVSAVKLEYTSDVGATWNSIIASTPASTHSYEWNVPNVNSDSVKVRISDVSNPALFDTSTSFFSISNTGVEIIIPVLNAQPSGAISLPVNTQWLYSATSISFTITYDPAKITFQNVESAPILSGVGFTSFSGNNGLIRIFWISLDSVDVNGNLFTMNFTGYDGTSSTDVVFSSAEILNTNHNPIHLRLIGGGLNTIATDVKSGLTPLVYDLKQNYPNPFNPATNIKFSIANDNFVNITVYNLLGQRVATLVNGFQHAGRYKVVWNAANFANGIYIYRIQAGKFTKVKKMILLK